MYNSMCTQEPDPVQKGQSKQFTPILTLLATVGNYASSVQRPSQLHVITRNEVGKTKTVEYFFHPLGK